MAIRTDYNEIFADMLETMGFSLERTQDGLFILYDNQLGKYRGDDDGLARFISASDIIGELDLYIEGSFFNDLEDEFDGYNEGVFDGEPPYSSEDWIAFMDARPEFKKDHEFDYEAMQLMANHIGEVDLNKVCGEKRAANKGLHTTKGDERL